MRRNLDLIIILTLSVLVCGVLYLLYDSTNDFSVSKKNNITMSRGSGSRVIPRGSVNGGIWTPKGVSGGLSSSRSVRVSPQSYRRSSMQATSTNSSLVSSSRSLMSNRSANTVSIVGGNTANFGRTAEANMSQPLAYGGGAGYPSVNVPSMRSANPVVAAAPAYVGVDAGSMSVPCQSFPTVSVPNYGYGNVGEVSLFGSSSSYKSTPSIGGSSPIYKAPSVVGGGTNKDDDDVDGSWRDWLNTNGHNGGDDGIYSDDEANEAYEALFGNWNSDLGAKPTKDQFLEWLENDGKYVPLGDIAPLFMLAFAYLAMLLIRRKNN